MKRSLIVLAVLIAAPTYGQSNPPFRWRDHGVLQPLKYEADCLGSGISCVPSGDTIAITVASGGAIVADLPLAGNGTSGSHLRLPNTAVSAGSYGDASHVGSFVVDAQGRITSAVNATIAIAQAAVANLVTDLAAKIGVSGATMAGPFAFSGTQTGTYVLGGVVKLWLSQALGIGTAQTEYARLENTTPAASDAQQWSPVLSLFGQRWNGSASKSVGWRLQAVSVGNGANEGRMRLSGEYDGIKTDWFDFMPSEFGEPRIKNPALASTFIDFGGSLRLSSQSGAIKPIDTLVLAMGFSDRAFSEVYTRHLVSVQAAAPFSAPGTGAGTGGTCTILPHGTDTVGVLEIVAGTGPASGGAVICTTTVNSAFNNPVVCATSAPDNAAVRFDLSAGSTTTWVLKNPTATGISGTVDVPYTCIDSVL